MSEDSGACSRGTVFILSRGKEALCVDCRLHSDLWPGKKGKDEVP